MATQTYNTGRVVGWSSYEEFLKENPDVDPSVVTEQIYSTATTYGVTYATTLNPSTWSGTNILQKTIPIPGAIWGVVPIIGAYYDGLEGGIADTAEFVAKKKDLERMLGNIFSCYVSNSAGYKVKNSTSESGYITFLAHPDILQGSLTELPILIRGLGVQALNTPGCYMGPEGLLFGGNGLHTDDWAQYTKVTWAPIGLNGSRFAWRIIQETKTSPDADPGVITFLSFAPPSDPGNPSSGAGDPYSLEGSDGSWMIESSGSGTAHLTWKDLMIGLTQNKSLDLSRAISNVIKGGNGINIKVNGDNTITITNTRPYDPGGLTYTTLNQLGYTDTSTSTNHPHYKTVRYNYFLSYDETGQGSPNWVYEKREMLPPWYNFNDAPIITKVQINRSYDTFSYNGDTYPSNIQITISANVQDGIFTYSIGKREYNDARSHNAGYGFYYNSSELDKSGFAFMHGNDIGSTAGQLSHLFGISFDVNGSEFQYIHNFLNNGLYRFKSTTTGSTGIWNILRNPDYPDPATSTEAFGASWQATCQAYMNNGHGTGRDNCDILVVALGYGDGYNQQLTRWSANRGKDLLAHHLNVEVSGIIYHP